MKKTVLLNRARHSMYHSKAIFDALTEYTGGFYTPVFANLEFAGTHTTTFQKNN